MPKRLARDASASTLTAGLLVVLVGITGAAALVFEAARAFGLGAEGASSWLGSLCVAVGALSIALSLWYRTPAVIAWSTPTSALLAAGAPGVTMPELVGAFAFSGLLFVICGATGLFARFMERVPKSLSAALLAGVLLRFSVETFASLGPSPLIVGLMCAVFVAGRALRLRLTMLAVLAAGMAAAWWAGALRLGDIEVKAATFVFTAPELSWKALVSVGVPVFIVTMASQNLPGIAILRESGYQTSASALLTWCGIGNVLAAPFGGFSVNLAAMTSAIAMGPESHPRPDKRYVAAVVAGFFYVVVGVFAGTVTSALAAFPRELVTGIAGLALIATTSASLRTAFADDGEREGAFVTFAVTASGLTLFGIGSAFWGISAGALFLALTRPHRR